MIDQVFDQLKRWGPMFGSAWLASKVLLAQLAERLINFHGVMGHTDQAATVKRLADAFGIDLHLATTMGTSAALLVVAGLLGKCISLYKDYKSGKLVAVTQTETKTTSVSSTPEAVLTTEVKEVKKVEERAAPATATVPGKP